VYFLFGFTYVIYATFLVTTLVQERGFSEAAAGNLWFYIGLLSLFSGPVFGTLSDHRGRHTALVLVFLLQALAYALAALPPGPPAGLYLSVLLFGLCAWSVPSIMAAAVGDCLGPRRAADAFGAITFFFGIGQILGPGLAGLLAETSGSFAGAYLLAALLALAAALLAGLLHIPTQRESAP
jgi:MFS family permease